MKKDISIYTDPFYSDSNMAHLRRSIPAQNVQQGKEYELIEEEIIIDEAEKAAAMSDVRYRGEEVFNRARARIYESK